MGNQIQNLNNISEGKIIKEEKIIKATINSTISLSQSKILINESEFQSISDYSKNYKNNDSTKFYLINKSKCNRIEDTNKNIRNSHIDNTCNINKAHNKNINYNSNNNNGLNVENDSKFINFDVINDNSELYDLSKIDDDLILNEKENKDINDEYEYEFEEYIKKLNSKNINIDKQLNERPLFSPFMLNSDKKGKDSKKVNNDISKIIKNKINKRNKKKDYFNDLKINQKNKAIKIFETTNSLYVNKNDYLSTNQRSKSKSKNTNEKTVSSNTNITNIENNNSSSRQKKIILVDFNKINKQYLNKEKIKKNLKLPKINKKRIDSLSNTIFGKENKKEEKKKCLSNNSRKINRMLTERRNIHEIIQKNNLTNLILDSNKTKTKNRNLKKNKNIHISLSQTFEMKKPNGNLYKCQSSSFITNNDDKKNKNKISKVFNKFNPMKEITNIRNLKLTNSCSNLFSQYNKIIFCNKNRNLSNKRTNKNSQNFINLNYYKISPTSQCNKKVKEKKLYIKKKYKTNLNSNEKSKNNYINTSNETTIFNNKKNKESKNNINKVKKMKNNNYEIIKKQNTKKQNSISYKRFNQINKYKDYNPYNNNFTKRRNIYKIMNIDKLLNNDIDDICKIKNIILSPS